MGCAHGKELRSPRKTIEAEDGCRRSSRPRSFHESLVREREHFENFSDYYEILDCIGRGGLCKVYKIQKKHDKIGGSSRVGNVRRPVRPSSKQPRYRFLRVPASTSVELISATALDIQSTTSKLEQSTKVQPNALLASSTQNQVQYKEMVFALKDINLAIVPADKIEQLKNEVEILKTLDHKNIIKAYETFTTTNNLMIVMELCTGGDLVRM